MAHEISVRAGGFAEMAYVGEKPWHGLGQELHADASLEQWAAAAGMDWRVKKSFVRYATGPDAEPGAMLKDEENVVLFRSDNKSPLGIVSKDFKVVQPHEMLEFFRDLLGSAGYRLCTAGVLRGGRKFWAQAENGQDAAVVGNDVVKAKLLIATACDGSMRTKVKKVSERVVCANTLAIACKEGGDEINVSHRSNFDGAKAKAQLGISTVDFQVFMGKCQELARAPVSKAAADQFLLPIIAEIMRKPLDVKNQEQVDDVRSYVAYRKIMALFNGDMRGASRTAWGLVNAVTEYTDHHRGNAATTRDTRMDYAWFGEGDKLKSKVFDQAVMAFA